MTWHVMTLSCDDMACIEAVQPMYITILSVRVYYILRVDNHMDIIATNVQRQVCTCLVVDLS